jgi:PP-loop superfamily ATP-utilizing enzyme
MQRNLLLNIFGIASLALLCSCNMFKKKEEVKKEEAEKVAQAEQPAVPAEATQATASNEENKDAATQVAQTEQPAATSEEAPAATEQKA